MARYPAVVNWNNRRYVPEGRRRRVKLEVVCPDCRQTRYVDKSGIDRLLKAGSFTGRCQVCNCRLRGKENHFRRGDRNGAWKGGRYLGSSGERPYVYRTVATEHPFYSMANHQHGIREHRLVVAERLGRPLAHYEHVHHIDGNTLNNRPENLVLLNCGEHARVENLIRSGRIKREEVGRYAVAV